MSQSADVIIVGLGAMGSAVAYHLSRRGERTLGLDCFATPHSFGSSHGETRAIREAYFEHPLYVPIVRRAYELWSELEQVTGRNLFLKTGGLMIGRSEGIAVAGSRRSAELHHLPYELLSADEANRRFPALCVPEGMMAVLEPRAGVLSPEDCIRAHLDAARQHGAVIRLNEQVLDWKADGAGVRVITAQGEYSGKRLVITAGAWMSKLLPGLGLPLWVERIVFFWFDAQSRPEQLLPDRFPLFIWEHEPNHFFCGFPNIGSGVKVARHHDGERTDVDTLRRSVEPEEVEDIRTLVQRLIPVANGKLRATAVCMYTNTPDGHFILDFHPQHRQLLIVSPCSGHGFKFSSAIGEIAADLLVCGESKFNLTPFHLSRFRQHDR
jgi:sarcosine oxidase